MHKRFPILVVLLASSALMALSGQSLSAQGAACEGAGIYRPFNFIRQFKLATAYFVNPSLPDRVRVFYAYNLKEAIDVLGREAVAKEIEDKAMQLSLPVNRLSLPVNREVREVAWAPSSYMIHCDMPAPDFADADLELAGADLEPVWTFHTTEGLSYTPVSAPKNLTEWLGNLSPNDTPKFHILSDNDFSPGTDDRVITWDPGESVAVVRNDGVAEVSEPEADSAPDR